MGKAIIVYWSGTGNTETMAEKIYEGMQEKYEDVKLKLVSEVTAEEVLTYDKIALGCPSMGLEELESDEFEPFFEDLVEGLGNKHVALFGSYGWGEAEWMDIWEEDVLEANGILFERGLTIESTPSTEEEDLCFEFGKRFANK